MAHASMFLSLPGRPPPMPLLDGSDGHRDSESELSSFEEHLRAVSDLISGSGASAAGNLASTSCPSHNDLASSAAPSVASNIEPPSPANEIINIFNNAMPGVRLTPVAYPAVPVPPSRPYRLNFLLPSQLRAITACNLQRPSYCLKVADDEERNAKVRGPPIGRAAPAA